MTMAIQWLRAVVPSNTRATLHGLGRDCQKRRVLGETVEIRILAHDETNTSIRPSRLMADIRRAGGRGLVGFVGVQSNQFARALVDATPEGASPSRRSTREGMG